MKVPSSGGGVYTASIPGAAAGHLIRYRVVASNAAATTMYPRVDDTAVYRGVFESDSAWPKVGFRCAQDIP